MLKNKILLKILEKNELYVGKVWFICFVLFWLLYVCMFICCKVKKECMKRMCFRLFNFREYIIFWFVVFILWKCFDMYICIMGIVYCLINKKR